MRWIHLGFLAVATVFGAWLVLSNAEVLWTTLIESPAYAWRIWGAAAVVPVVGMATAWGLWAWGRPWTAWVVTAVWILFQISGLPWKLGL